MTDDKFYIHDKTRGYVGNSMLWWKYNNCGYVCDIREAKVFSREEAEQTLSKTDDLEIDDLEMWPKDYIDKRIQHHIDMQTVHRSEVTTCNLTDADNEWNKAALKIKEKQNE